MCQSEYLKVMLKGSFKNLQNTCVRCLTLPPVLFLIMCPVCARSIHTSQAIKWNNNF